MNFENFTYLFYIALFNWLPILILLIKYKKYVKRNLTTIIKAFLISLPVAVIWDALSIYNRVWYYNADRILNIYIGIMPAEEIVMLSSSILGISIVTVLFYEYLTKHKIIK